MSKFCEEVLERFVKCKESNEKVADNEGKKGCPTKFEIYKKIAIYVLLTGKQKEINTLTWMALTQQDGNKYS